MRSVFFGTILSILFLTACNKDEDNNLGGKARMKFNANPAFLGHELYEINYAPATYTRSDSAVGIRQITVTAATGTRADDHFATVFIQLPANLNTSNGPITIDFSQPFPSTFFGQLTMGVLGFSYFKSKSGTLTITKLDYSEIEGFFSCQAEAQMSGGDITITNGTFAGKL